MDDRSTEHLYQDYVVAHGLERTAVLEALRARCEGAPTVLYPGCFLHVTPSFYFQHVVYVDRQDLARDFFAHREAVLHLLSSRKQYRQQPFFRFLHQDFTRDLPVPDESFDVLLALYAGGISKACARYLKPGGLLLTNNHQGDAMEAAALAGLELRAVIEERRGKVHVREAGAPFPGERPRGRSLSMEYFLFAKLGAPAAPAPGRSRKREGWLG